MDSADHVSGIAAPLLAGFSLALIGVVVQLPAAGSDVLLRDASFLSLACTVMIYLLALNYSVSARGVRVSDADLRRVWTNTEDCERARLVYQEAFSRADERGRLLVEVGNLGLLSSLLIVLIPAGQYSPIRISVTVLLAGAVLLQIMLIARRWTGVDYLPRFLRAILLPHHRWRDQLPPVS
jgi:hypothetical protein